MSKKAVITSIEGQQIRLTNLEKVLYPDANISKAEFIQFYVKIAPYFLHHNRTRPLTLIRYPDGILGKKFYSKNSPEWTPDWVVTDWLPQDKENKYVVAENTATLAWLANIASCEIHPLHENKKGQIDRVIFDLDPPEDQSFEKVKQVALQLKTFLEGKGYVPFVKTSGSKGLHIYVPIIAVSDNTEVMSRLKELAKAFVSANKDTTLAFSKKDRQSRVFIDILRNNNLQSCVAPYSTRARKGAPVSTPLFWEELPDVTASDQYKIDSVLELLDERGDPWKDFRSHAVAFVQSHPVEVPDSLKKYQELRDFQVTTEPEPTEVFGNNDQYVVQLHDASNLHYDLRLERDGVLLSWAIPKGLPAVHGNKHLAIQTENHPMKYLDFEGVIPKDKYGGGTMWIFDRGTYTTTEYSDSKIKFTLKGRLNGSFFIFKTKGAQWLIERTTDKPLPTWKSYQPMLAAMGSKVSSKSDYFFEVKWDGIRVTVHKHGDSAIIYSRSGNDISTQFPSIIKSLQRSEPEHFVVDGEIVALDAEGKPLFNKIISRLHTKAPADIERLIHSTPATLYLFDCLYLDGLDCRNNPNVLRREWLQANFQESKAVRISKSFEDGQLLFDAIATQGMEGIMCKHKSAKYESGRRTNAWTKIKVRQEATSYIIGYTTGEGDRSEYFGALHLADRDGDDWVYRGKVGTGYDHAKMQEIFAVVSTLPSSEKLIRTKIEESSRTTWVQPQYQCEIVFASMTNTGTYREPVFQKLIKDE